MWSSQGISMMSFGEMVDPRGYDGIAVAHEGRVVQTKPWNGADEIKFGPFDDQRFDGYMLLRDGEPETYVDFGIEQHVYGGGVLTLIMDKIWQ